MDTKGTNLSIICVLTLEPGNDKGRWVFYPYICPRISTLYVRRVSRGTGSVTVTSLSSMARTLLSGIVELPYALQTGMSGVSLLIPIPQIYFKNLILQYTKKMQYESSLFFIKRHIFYNTLCY